MQVMGLLLLRDDALEKMQEFMFPNIAKSKGKIHVNPIGLSGTDTSKTSAKKNL